MNISTGFQHTLYYQLKSLNPFASDPGSLNYLEDIVLSQNKILNLFRYLKRKEICPPLLDSQVSNSLESLIYVSSIYSILKKVTYLCKQITFHRNSYSIHLDGFLYRQGNTFERLKVHLR